MKQVFFASLLVLGSYAAAFAHSESEETTPANDSRVTAVFGVPNGFQNR